MKKGTKQDHFEGGRNIIFLCFDLLLSAISQVAANDEAVKKDNKHLTSASMALCTSRDFSFAATHGEIVIVCDGVLLSFFCRRSRVINENFAEFWAVVYWLRSRSDGDCHCKAKRLTEIPHRKWAWNSAVWLSCASIATKGSFKKLVFSALFDSEHKQRQKPCCHYGVFL